MADETPALAEMSFEEAMAELEQVVARLERARWRWRTRSSSTRGAPICARLRGEAEGGGDRVSQIAQGADGAVPAHDVEIP